MKHKKAEKGGVPDPHATLKEKGGGVCLKAV